MLFHNAARSFMNASVWLGKGLTMSVYANIKQAGQMLKGGL